MADINIINLIKIFFSNLDLFNTINSLSMHISWGLGFLYDVSKWLLGGWNKQ